ncbi:double-strand break repair helicase AddA [Bombella sp. TMW 2.2559]|uniref:DNA 3'-5' helicase n=1 Tax=Bombella dulcis TaxID=2967339 RepID=A0ABT3WD56_9PROT|nr:double-strand break repair helicase AddA [Bombella dulcis]MCX5616876.1 double-strand break repair helicase AddA [Bombella dulcis]
MTQRTGQRKADHQKALDAANEAQKRASNPMASVFVSASAGSGKTKLLIDRLLRLMLPLEQIGEDGQPVLLGGSEPSRILCLTYTKAAAAEMAHRLQSHLGHWVSLSDEKLGEALAALDVPNTAATRERARGLFLKVLDAPGGLQIETIHAFCQSLLRRFPLEAALDPHFVLMEEADSQMALRRALEDSLARNQDPVQVLATLTGFDRLMGLLEQFNAQSGLLQPLLHLWERWPERLKQAYQGLLDAGSESSEELMVEACRLEDEAAWRADIQAALPQLADFKREQFGTFLAWLEQTPAGRDRLFLTSLLFTQKGEIRNMSRHLGAKARNAAPGLEQRLLDEARRQQEMQERIRTQRLLEINTAFLALALPVMGRFADEKRSRGTVDYNDLIARTRDVLREPGAAWVLYKLDGGIDHLLLDEVQDNSGLQWEIAGALTTDFFSGAGGREEMPRPRTVFAVGDFKQSIYSFQGAEPEQFHKWRQEFARRVQSAGLFWEEPGLHVSFRSLEPVLTFVDAVFEDDADAGGNEALDGLREQGDSNRLEHQSARSGGGGRVELWPLVPADRVAAAGVEGGPAGQVLDPWRAPEKNEDQRSAQQRLADALASYLRGQIGHPLQPGTAPLKAGEVMILVPKRSAFLRALIRALKARDVPVASFISSGLVEQPAVQDLMTLCDALLLPQDDLSLASVLTSPLGDLTDESLMALATADGQRRELGRDGTPLWSVLARRHEERTEWRAAWQRLQALYRRVDYDTPYDILMQALGVQGGRARLLARLGAEAAEPVDELLTAALTYETQHPPSLQGFLHWLRSSMVDSRREVEAEIDAVRIMTVHRSKGLQARLVILPDTTSTTGRPDPLLWTELEADMPPEGNLAGDALHGPLWIPQVRMGTERTRELLSQQKVRQREEKNRLFYVALTRASDALLICGWEPRNAGRDSSWYDYCRAGMERLDVAEALPFEGDWGDEKLVLEMPVTASWTGDGASGSSFVRPALPDWMGQAPDWQVQPAPHEDALARPLAPSRPEAMAYGPLPAARSPLEIMREGLVIPQPARRRQDAMERGTLVHRLLQFLPDLPAGERQGKAEAWLRHTMPGLAEADVVSLAGHVVSVVGMDVLAPLFGPGSRAEQGISGTLGHPGDGTGRVVLGQVDRFCFDGQTVWLCDYKTGRSPSRPDRVPAAYLGQMASYRRVMQGLYPGHPVRCFLVWVDGPAVTELPAALLDEQKMVPG